MKKKKKIDCFMIGRYGVFGVDSDINCKWCDCTLVGGYIYLGEVC